MPEADITLEVVKAKLRDEVEKWEAQSGNEELDKRNNVKPAGFSMNRFGVCYICGEKGHFKRDCKKFPQSHQNRGGGGTGFQRGINRGTYRGQRGGYNRGQSRRGYRRGGIEEKNRIYILTKGLNSNRFFSNKKGVGLS
ncbi:hypothetical protein Trydic_g20122 [Trypoxylus dichotomus]